MASNAIQEFVIKLSAQVDNSGISQMMNLLDSNKMKALGLTAALTAASTAVYKFIESATKTEIELTALAKKQNKTIEATRASETALKSMGKTLNEIKKDAALQSIYNDLVKVNKAMALPDMSDTISMIRKLQGAFWELRSTVTYAVQWIYAKVMGNLEEPITRITDKLHEISQWVQKNMQSITTTISSFITGFAKGIVAIVESIEQIVEWVNDLPAGIKQIGTAIGIVWGLLKSGPIGQIMTAITMIGGLIDDYENFKWNQEHESEFVPETEDGLHKVGVAFEELWTKIDPFLKTGDVGGIFDTLVTSLTSALTRLSDTLDKLDIANFLKDPGEKLGGFVDQITAWLDTEKGGGGANKIAALGGAIWRFLESALGATGEISANLAGFLVKIFTPENLDAAVDDALSNNTLAQGAGTAAILKLLGVSDIGALAGGLLTTWKQAREKAEEQIKSEGDTGASDQDVNKLAVQLLGGDAVKLGKGILEMVAAGIGLVENAGSILYEALADALGSDTAIGQIADLLGGEDGQGSIIGDALTRGLFSGLTTGNFVVGLTGFLTKIVGALSSPEEREQLSKEIEGFAAAFSDMLFGKIVDETTGERAGGLFGFLKDIWSSVEPYLQPIWDGVRDWLVELGSNLWGWISPYITVFGVQLKMWLDEFLESNGLLKWVAEKFGYNTGTSTFGIDSEGNIVTAENMLKEGNSVQEIADAITRGRENPVLSEMQETGGFALQNGQLVLKAGKSGNQGVFETSLEERPEVKNATSQLNEAILEGDTRKASGILAAITTLKNGQNSFLLADRAKANNAFANQFSTLNSYTNASKESLEQRLANYLGLDLNEVGNSTIASMQFQDLLDTINNRDLSYEEKQWEFQDKWDSLSGLSSTPEDKKSYSKFLIASEGMENAGNAADNTADAFSDVAGKSREFGRALEELIEKIASFNPGGEGGTGGEMAYGGRVGSRQDNLTVGEDGTEYIIPITKPERAYNLIMQMLGEMGSTAISRVAEGLGLGEDGTIGASMDSIAQTLGGLNMNMSYTISAPVTITVTSNSADAEDIGTAAYNAAERHLLRNLRGVFA